MPLRSRYPLPFGWGPIGLVLLVLGLLALKALKDLRDDHPEGLGEWLASLLAVSEETPDGTPSEAPKSPIVVAMLGDSHIAADIFSGHVRMVLQKRYGESDGLILPLGQPHPGIRNALVSVQATGGWTTRTVMNTPGDGRFLLPGTLVETSVSDQRLHWQVRHRALAFNSIELVVQSGPLAGQIDLVLDGEAAGSFNLTEPRDGVTSIVLRPKPGGDGTFKSLALITRSNQPVSLLQVLVKPVGAGVSVPSAGYPGATIAVFDRMENAGFDQAMKELNPDFLVLAFGTNEGFDDNLSAVRYQQIVTRQLTRFKTLLPDARLVLVSPPMGAKANSAQECGWQEPVKLPIVRRVQDQVAQSQSVVVWSWAQIMPQSCAGHQWTLEQPRLMADDHIHLTGEGYRRSAEAFVTFVIPLIEQRMRERGYAVPYH